MTKSTRSAFCSLFLALAGQAAAVGIEDVQISVTSDSNPAKAQNDIDIESSVAARVELGILLLSSDEDTSKSAWFIDSTVSMSHNNDFEGLGENRYQLGAEWLYEPGSGRLDPLYSARLEATAIDAESNIRDGTELSFTTAVNWQLAPTIGIDLGLRHDSRQADGDTFDTQKTQLFTRLSAALSPRLSIQSGIAFVTGDEVSTATPTVAIVNAAKAIEADSAFGGFNEEKFAYLIDADSLLVDLETRYGLSESASLALTFRYVRTEASDDISYDRRLLSLTYSQGFGG